MILHTFFSFNITYMHTPGKSFSVSLINGWGVTRNFFNLHGPSTSRVLLLHVYDKLPRDDISITIPVSTAHHMTATNTYYNMSIHCTLLPVQIQLYLYHGIYAIYAMVHEIKNRKIMGWNEKNSHSDTDDGSYSNGQESVLLLLLLLNIF